MPQVSGESLAKHFFQKTTNSERYIHDIFNPLSNEVTDEERQYRYFQQDNAAAHTC